MQDLAVLGGVGTLVLLFIAFLAFISPIFFYLTQRNTYQTRQELKTANRKFEKVIEELSGINERIDKFIEVRTPETAPDVDNPTREMNCPDCGKYLKYDKKHSGQYKPCPECKKTILLK